MYPFLMLSSQMPPCHRGPQPQLHSERFLKVNYGAINAESGFQLLSRLDVIYGPVLLSVKLSELIAVPRNSRIDPMFWLHITRVMTVRVNVLIFPLKECYRCRRRHMTVLLMILMSCMNGIDSSILSGMMNVFKRGILVRFSLYQGQELISTMIQ